MTDAKSVREHLQRTTDKNGQPTTDKSGQQQKNGHRATAKTRRPWRRPTTTTMACRRRRFSRDFLWQNFRFRSEVRGRMGNATTMAASKAADFCDGCASRYRRFKLRGTTIFWHGTKNDDDDRRSTMTRIDRRSTRRRETAARGGIIGSSIGRTTRQGASSNFTTSTRRAIHAQRAGKARQGRAGQGRAGRQSNDDDDCAHQRIQEERCEARSGRIKRRCVKRALQRRRHGNASPTVR